MISERRAFGLPTIKRAHLLEEFHAADPQIVKLIAPAGYGKTTFATALAKPDQTVVRCDCLLATSPIDLVRGVLEAIGNTMPEADRFRVSDAFISLGDNLAEWLRYTRRVFELERKPALLVFDNGETLVDKPAVRTTMERLLPELPVDIKIIFCSRVDVPINFARFAGPDRTMRVGPDQLRFDRDEIALLFSRVGAGASIVARVNTFTQGWPMLVMMLFVLAKRGRLEAYLSGTGIDASDLYGYLASEVLATLEPAARDLLEAVVALPDARQSDLEALYGRATGPRIVELELATPFLSRMPSGTLDVHPAIAEMLRKESTRGVELAREISEALATSEPVRAARIAAHLGEFDRAASLLENARYFLRTPSLDLVDVLYALPPESLIRFPAVWNVASYSRALARDATEWLNEADRVLAAMPQATPIDVRVELFAGFMNVYTQRGEFAKARSFSAAFSKTAAGEHPMGQVTIRFWELVTSAFLGEFIDREQWQREVGPIMRVKTMEIITDFDIFARHERLAGDAVKERAILGRAVEEARASGDVLLRYLTLTEALFGAWFWGDEHFSMFVDDFERAVHPSTERATSLLLAACRGRVATVAPGTEQLKVRAYAYLIGAATERNADRRRNLLHQAVLSADKCAQPFTAAIARVALGVADPERAQSALCEARSLAGQTWSTVFQDAIDAVCRGRLTGHMLEAFVKRFRAEIAEVADVSRRMAISLVNGTVQVADVDIALSGREFELLVYLALRNGPAESELLTEALWPESDADRARTSLKVTVSRLRSRLGNNSLILATDNGYTIAANCVIDLTALLSGDEGALHAVNPAPKQLAAARRRLSRWGWAKKYDVRLAELEALTSDTIVGREAVG